MKIFDYLKLTILCILLLFSLKLLAENKTEDNKQNLLGDINAPNLLVEYASLSCIHCANFHNSKLPEIKEKLISTGKLKYIYKDFPLDMPAMLAAMVTNCYKGEQFHIILNSLFRNQKKWVSVANNKEDLLRPFTKF